MKTTQTAALGSCVCPTPVGELALFASPRGLTRVTWEVEMAAPGGDTDYPVLRAATRALGLHFDGAGAGGALATVPLDLRGTEFQIAVWRALAQTVGAGQLVTYGELAARAGRPGASRAVGQAMNRNPVPIFVPCHRVVAAGGRPGGSPRPRDEAPLARLRGRDDLSLSPVGVPAAAETARRTSHRSRRLPMHPRRR